MLKDFRTVNMELKKNANIWKIRHFCYTQILLMTISIHRTDQGLTF